MRKVFYIERSTKKQVDLIYIARHKDDQARYAVYIEEGGQVFVQEMNVFNIRYYEKGSIG